MCLVQCLTGTEIGNFPKSGFEHLRGCTFKKYRSQTDLVPNQGTISNTFPDFNHQVEAGFYTVEMCAIF